jgi:hypothetical protein
MKRSLPDLGILESEPWGSWAPQENNSASHVKKTAPARGHAEAAFHRVPRAGSWQPAVLRQVTPVSFIPNRCDGGAMSPFANIREHTDRQLIRIKRERRMLHPRA